MCGIFGWFGTKPTEYQEVVALQSRLLSHRGPDDQGFATATNAEGHSWGFGFRRLSILDLSPTGHQPMQTDDGRFQLVFNGEIYNYVELRQQICHKVATFRGTSDTEVLLHLLATQGAAALSLLNGMFALAFVDTVTGDFLLARDRLGKKPLYYAKTAEQLRFASELKALLAWPDGQRHLNLTAVAHYLIQGYLPNQHAIFDGYQKVPPGYYLQGNLAAPQEICLQPYWKLPLLAAQENLRKGVQSTTALSDCRLEELTALATDAVRIRMRSDVPVGIFLSGGVDSGLVATLAAQVADTPPLALTVGFAEAAYDEKDAAHLVAAKAHLPHQVIQLQPQQLDELDRLAWFYDEPFADASALPTMALCAAAAEHATVFLSGDGGDESFAGYRRYIAAQQYRWLQAIPAPIQQGIGLLGRLLPYLSSLRYQIDKSMAPDAGFAAAFDSMPTDPILSYVVTPSLRAHLAQASREFQTRWAASRGYPLVTRQQQLDYDLYLPDDILVKMDRAAMAHSIEVRSPWLDYRLVEWAAQLPRSTLLDTTQGKLPLRALGRTLLPPSVQSGEKRGFGVPLVDWFRTPDGVALLRERLLSPEAQRRNLWQIPHVARLIEHHQSARGRSVTEMLWRLLMFDAWA
ncbi:MAG: asparagine synthase (glutamine-hydrolyzing), partial [Caldilineaceae bacterium]|nr:asparagine synthase (glutamine-hydrolyzing) [Caldilineaceae bacterium]